MLSTLALSVSGALYDAAKYIPAPDVAALGLTPGVTRQQLVGWVVWTPAPTGGMDVSPAEEWDLPADRDVPEGTAHRWLVLDLVAATSPWAADAGAPNEEAAGDVVDAAWRAIKGGGWEVLDGGQYDRQIWQTFGGPNGATIRVVSGNGTEIRADQGGREAIAAASTRTLGPAYTTTVGGAIGVVSAT